MIKLYLSIYLSIIEWLVRSRLSEFSSWWAQVNILFLSLFSGSFTLEECLGLRGVQFSASCIFSHAWNAGWFGADQADMIHICLWNGGICHPWGGRFKADAEVLKAAFTRPWFSPVARCRGPILTLTRIPRQDERQLEMFSCSFLGLMNASRAPGPRPWAPPAAWCWADDDNMITNSISSGTPPCVTHSKGSQSVSLQEELPACPGVLHWSIYTRII